jgi:Flp pilus assembly protein TadG
MSRLQLPANRLLAHQRLHEATSFSRARRRRRAAAVVELAVLLPLLAILFVFAVDFARVFYISLTLTNCARAGALYACDPVTQKESPFPSVESAALADATNLSPQPTISSTTGVDASGRAYAEVTASSSFTTITKFPLVPSNLQLTRKVRMFLAPSTPNAN